MMARTHIAFGLLAGAIIAPYIALDRFVFYLLVVFGAMLPDIDHQNSSINKLMPVTNVLPHLFKHRGFFHSVFPVIGIVMGFTILSDRSIGIAIAVGYLAHLFSDALTKMGVNLLYPFTAIKLRGPITTGTKQEALACAFALAGAILFWSGF